MMESLRRFWLFVLPPGYLIAEIARTRRTSRKKHWAPLVFLGWAMCQWLLLVASYVNPLTGVLAANVGLAALIETNVFFWRGEAIRGDDVKRFLGGSAFRLVTALGTLSLLYLVAAVPAIVGRSWGEYLVRFSTAMSTKTMSLGNIFAVALGAIWGVLVLRSGGAGNNGVTLATSEAWWREFRWVEKTSLWIMYLVSLIFACVYLYSKGSYILQSG